MAMHIDEKGAYKKKIDKFKDEINRMNKEIQKKRQEDKKKWKEKVKGFNSLDFFYFLWYNINIKI